MTSMGSTVSLHCIVKDEVQQVIRIIENYGNYFDYLDFAIDDDKALGTLIAQDYNEKVRFFLYENRMPSGRIDFADKRNFLHKKCKTKYYFRIDTDDEIINPEKIKEVVKRADDDDVSVVCTYYDYSRDEWGNTNAAHYRETIIRNSNNLFWNKPIHENIIPVNPAGFALVHDDTVKIKHLIDKGHSDQSLKRNFEYLIEEYNKDKENTDPRTLAYLGRSLMGFGDFDRAIFFLEQHIKNSGWNEDRYLSWCQLAHIYRLKGDHQNSLASAFEALQEIPEYPDAYFEIHDTYFNQEKWNKAIQWALMGMSKKPPETNILIDPSAYTWRPTISLASCYFQIGDFEKAHACFKEAEKLVPTLDWIVEHKKIFDDALYHKRYTERFSWMLAFTKERESDRVVDLVKSVPKELHEHPVIARARNTILPPKEWGNNEVVIFCGHTWEPWSPKSVESGIGGSEEAAINLSKSLTKLGYKVTVFNDCGNDEGVYDGVSYFQATKFNPQDSFNILISWRSNVFTYGVEARKKIIWVHDLPINLALDEKTVQGFDKIVVLSKYHATLLPKCVPQDKIYISTNGIDVDLFSQINEERNPVRLIYASSYNRGLEHILDIWYDIKQAIPEAELHVFYGWNAYDRAVASGDVQDNGWKAKMVTKLNQDGVFEHGRIGHKELLKEYAKSGIFAYYCTYSGEINCIALTKALASGCFCITNNDFAVGERNPHVTVKNLKDFKRQIILALKTPHKVSVGSYKEDNSWDFVARKWQEELLQVKENISVGSRFKYIYSEIPSGTNLIDIGCASGDVFLDKDYPDITRVDIDNRPKLKNFVQADAHRLPFSDKKFDVAFLGEILEHVKDPVVVLQEAIRVSRKVVFTVPNEYEWTSDLVVPFDTLSDEEKDRGMTRQEIYKDSDEVIYNKDDNYEHLRHLRWYDEGKLRKDIEAAGAKKYKVDVLRFAGLSYFCGVIYADSLD